MHLMYCNMHTVRPNKVYTIHTISVCWLVTMHLIKHAPPLYT
jgi:hypothetical protein